jgi:hypothetical protein
MLPATEERIGTYAPIPACLWQENPHGLVSLWDMLQNYLPFYEISHSLGRLKERVKFVGGSTLYSDRIDEKDLARFRTLLESIQQQCKDFGLPQTAKLAERALARKPPKNLAELGRELDLFNDALTGDLEGESIFRIPLERRKYFECDDLFGTSVGNAFRSCARDIRKAGSCYALEQEDACVHHLMLVLERGLNALAGKVGVSYLRTNWQEIINNIALQLKSMPKGKEKDFYLAVNAQFGFLKDAYRNHSEHARDEHYDMPKAQSILNHVIDFMQALANGGLKE